MASRVTVLAVILILVAALVLGSRYQIIGTIQGLALDAVAPILGLTDASSRAVGTGRVATIDDLIQENQRLKAENQRLLQEAAKAPELQRENEQLRDLLNMRRNGAEWQWMQASVIGVDSNNLVRSAVINRGERDGLVQSMTVMTPRGLVGRIVQIGTSASRVLFITDPSSSANGMVQRSRARGVLYGQRTSGGGATLEMRYIPQGEEVAVGDTIISSGLGGIFPDGIPIGRVTQVQRRDTDMFQEATVEPFVDFEHLEEVYVIVNHVPIRLD